MPAAAAPITPEVRPEAGPLTLLGYAIGYVEAAERAADHAFLTAEAGKDAAHEERLFRLGDIRDDLEKIAMGLQPTTLVEAMVSLLMVARRADDLESRSLTEDQLVDLGQSIRRTMKATVEVLGRACGVDPVDLGARSYLDFAPVERAAPAIGATTH